jgi:multisubunit Na+/H+ antiporter MnhC subunit
MGDKIKIGFALLAIGLGTFGYWGVYTEAGRKQYDEMDGIIPVAALATAVVIALSLVILQLYFAFRSGGKN